MTHTQAYPGPGHSLGAMLSGSLSKSWWILLLRGLVSIAFGVATFVWPSITLFALTMLWGAYALSDGVISLGAAIFGRGEPGSSRGWLALVGLVGIAAGVTTFLWPGMTSLVLLMFIAAWAIVVGLLQIAGAIQLRKVVKGDWLLGLSGLLSVAFGVLMVARPGAGATATLWLIGAYAVVAGVLYTGLAFKVKRLGQPKNA